MLKNTLKVIFAANLFFWLMMTAYAEPINLLFHNTNDPIAGNPKGKITVVEFFDYQCSHCINMAPVMSNIIKDNPNVRVVFKEFPIRGPVSEFASRAALAANKQGKYFTFSHALLTAPQPLTENAILEIAQQSGLNIEKLKKEMDNNQVQEQLKNNIKLAESLQLTGTPAFFIGKTQTKNSKNVTFVLGAMSQSELQDAINKAKG